jgi:hypothetical protein
MGEKIIIKLLIEIMYLLFDISNKQSGSRSEFYSEHQVIRDAQDYMKLNQ